MYKKWVKFKTIAVFFCFVDCDFYVLKQTPREIILHHHHHNIAVRSFRVISARVIWLATRETRNIYWKLDGSYFAWMVGWLVLLIVLILMARLVTMSDWLTDWAACLFYHHDTSNLFELNWISIITYSQSPSSFIFSILCLFW